MPLERVTEAYKNLLEFHPPATSEMEADRGLGKSAAQEFWRRVSDFAIALAEETPKAIRVLEKRVMTVMPAYRQRSPLRKALKAFRELVDRTLPDTCYFGLNSSAVSLMAAG